MKCQKFHMSTLSVVVHFNAIMTRLMAMARMKIHGTIFAVPKEMAAATGQPASMMGRSSPVLRTIASAAGPRLSVRRPMTRLIPMNPIPMVSAARMALLSFILKNRLNKNMIIGRTTLAPRLRKY